MGHKWQEHEVKVLITLWEQYTAKLNGHRRNAPVYAEMADKINVDLKLREPVTGADINKKLENLKKQYRLEKKKLTSGCSPSAWWPYHQVHKIFGTRPVNDESIVSDSIDLPEAQGTSNDVVVHMIEEFGPMPNESSVFDDTQDLVTVGSSDSSSSCNVGISQSGSEDEVPAFPLSKKRKKEILMTWTQSNQCVMTAIAGIITVISDTDNTEDIDVDQRQTISSILSILRTQGSLIERAIWTKCQASEWFNLIFPSLSDKDFKAHFRVTKNTYEYLVKVLQHKLGKGSTNMRDTIPVRKRIAIALHYLASCEEYRVVSSLFGVGKSTAHEIVCEFVGVVNATLLAGFISFPSTVEALKTAVTEFEDLLGFPQCAGAVDGCHIPVCPPKDHAVDYYNYKGFHSIVLFAVVDARYRFIYVNVGSPGRNNDSYILQNSNLNAILQSKFFDKYSKEMQGVTVPVCLICDSAFPLKRHLMKPYPEHRGLDEMQREYNTVLCGARRVVENAFGRLKARFRILYKRMEATVSQDAEIIKACCILNNVCEYLNDKVPSDWNSSKMPSSMSNVCRTRDSGAGAIIRDAIARHLFECRNKM